VAMGALGAARARCTGAHRSSERDLAPCCAELCQSGTPSARSVGVSLPV